MAFGVVSKHGFLRSTGAIACRPSKPALELQSYGPMLRPERSQETTGGPPRHEPPTRNDMANPAIRRILCAVDFSEASEVAFARAREMARRFGAELRALHVWEVPDHVQADTAAWTSAIEPNQAVTVSNVAAKNGREAMAKLIASAKNDVRVTAQIECGNPATVIAELAERDAFDLIVMGTHGRSGFRRFVLGSVAETVMRHANCPVLVVPSRMT